MGYDFENNYIVLSKKASQNATTIAQLMGPSQQRNRTISGRVTDEKGVPVVGANIMEKGKINGTITDIDGSFTLRVEDNTTLQISYIGYLTQNINTAEKTTFNIILQEDTKALEELVVVGYGTKAKKDITGSVAVIDTKALLKTTGSSATQLLQGKSPGIYIGQTGSPGSATNVRIRGFNTINNNGPLYVIDGVSTTSQNLSSLNPNDIESMQVLKDASASAIYGAQAANGVIIITTKQGNRSGKTTISYDSYYGVQKAVNKWDLMNSEERLAYEWEGKLNQLRLRGNTTDWPSNPQFGTGPEPKIPNYLTYSGAGGRQDLDPNDYSFPDNIMYEFSDTDWWAEANRLAPIQNHQFSVSGGNDRGQYLVGLNYFDQQGTLIHTYYKRYQTRINATFDIKNWLRIGENLQFSLSKANGQQDDTGDASYYSGLYRTSPWLPVKDIGGNWSGSETAGIGGSDNRVALLTERKDNFEQNTRLFGNVWAEIDFLPKKELTFRTSFGFDYTTGWAYAMSKSMPELGYHVQNYFDESTSFNTRYVWTNTLTYDKTFNKVHDLNVILGTEAIRDGIGRGMSGRRYNYLFEDNVNTWTLGMGENNLQRTNNSFYNGEFALFGTFARADYDYADKYLLTAIVRRDGTSRFSKKYRYGIFPSGSVGWRISEEEFMADSKGWLDDMKFRVGYGLVGNSEIPRSTNFANLFTTDPQWTNYDLSGANSTSDLGYRLNSIGNPDTRWETIKMLNVGLDATFGGNRFNTTLEYYHKRTSDMLIGAAYSSLAGSVSAPYENYGSMKNYGWDFMFNYNDKVGDFAWDISLNLSTYKNKVLSLSSESAEYALWGDAYRLNNSTNKTMAGYPVAEFFGYDLIGFYEDEQDVLNSPTPYGASSQQIKDNPMAYVGKFKIADHNDDGKITASDRIYYGSPHPDLIGSINASLTWKNFDFTMFWYSVLGNEIMNTTKVFTDWHMHNGNRSRRIIGTHWKLGADNSNAKLPILDYGDNWTGTIPTQYFLEDGSFLKMKNIVIGYSFPKSLLKKATISNLRLYVQAENLLTITNYTGLDPEITNRDTGSTGAGTDLTRGVDTGGWPTTMRFLFGVNFEF